MKHNIALIFSMVVPYLLDMNFTNLERKHCFQKKVILLQTMQQQQNYKKTRHLVVEKWPRQTLFSTKIFLRVERVFLKVLAHQNSTLFRNCKGMRLVIFHHIVFS